MNESSIGEVLRLAREQQGLTLQDVSYALNIKREYLEALEKDEYDAIPGAVWSKVSSATMAISWNWTALPWPGNIRKTSKSGPQPEVRTIMPVKKKKIRKDKY